MKKKIFEGASLGRSRPMKHEGRSRFRQKLDRIIGAIRDMLNITADL